LSAAWIRNSEQYGSRILMESSNCESAKTLTNSIE
jgi:hypothetical protein